MPCTGVTGSVRMMRSVAGHGLTHIAGNIVKKPFYKVLYVR